MKIITDANGKTFRMGRNRPVARCPRLSLKNYLTMSLPAPPVSVGYAADAKSALSQMYLNDSLGDCVIAGMAHVEGVLTGNVGSAEIFSNSEITALYSAIGGYVPGDPSTDQGCDEQTALNYWQQNGLLYANPISAHKSIGAHKIAGWMSVNPSDPVEVRTALWLFENLIFGVELPDAWVNPMPSAADFVWQSAGEANPENGHCFVATGYGKTGLQICTWGMLGYITNAAVRKYAGESQGGELYCVISQDGIAKASQKAPNGFDWSQLLADFDSMKA
jgi:hypothetical protein